ALRQYWPQWCLPVEDQDSGEIRGCSCVSYPSRGTFNKTGASLSGQSCGAHWPLIPNANRLPGLPCASLFVARPAVTARLHRLSLKTRAATSHHLLHGLHQTLLFQHTLVDLDIL